MHHLNLKTQLKKNSGPLNFMFDFIPLHLTFQGDVGALKPEKSLSKQRNKNKWILFKIQAFDAST